MRINTCTCYNTEYMDQEIAAKIEALESKVDAVYRSSEKMRKYFLWTLVITAAVVILPLIGLLFVIPQFISQYSSIPL